MKRQLTIALAALALVLANASPSHADLGKPDFGSDEFQRRMAASYGVLSSREPAISEVETAILEKRAGLMAEDPAAARAMLQEILADGKPVSAAFNQVLGNLYFTAGEFAAAERQYLTAIRKFPDFQRAWNSLGTLRVQLDRFGEGAEALARSIELGASDAETFGMLGYALLRQRQYLAAEVAYDMALLRAPTEIKWLEGKMRILAESGRHREAITAADELLAIDPGNLEYWRVQANAHLALGQLAETARNIEIARLLGPVDADALYLLGNIYIRQDMPNKALGAYLAALELQPGTKISTLISVARSLLAQNETELARRLINTLEVDPARASPRDRLRHALIRGRLAERDGDTVAAIAAFEEALAIDPLDPETLFRLARAYAAAGKTEKARYHLERIKGDPNYEYGAQLFIARLYIDAGMLEKALAPLRQALRIRPGTEVENLYNRLKVAVETAAIRTTG
ncbi:MAG: tetratricopeptide repeat protein [Verrucomicrobia bacterium]|nr:MAG: tetratricopeptide repeat protein [Verrucomicrobiota bacterium]